VGRSHGLLTLLRLARLHWRAGVRKQFRRLRTPSGCIFGVFGMLLIAGWLGFLMFGPSSGGADLGQIDVTGEGVDLRFFLAQTFLAAFGFLSLMGACNAKGLYLPKAEAQALLSAPISTSDLVRYRLFVDGGKAALSAVIFVALFWGRLPSPGFGVFGILLALLSITVGGRMVSLALGNTNLWMGRMFSGRALGRVAFMVGMVVWFVLVGSMVSSNLVGDFLGGEESLIEQAQVISKNPIVVVLLLPMRPFAELVLAETAVQFLTWLAVDVAILVLLFELCAYSAGEIREATLTTSEEFAKRIGAMRKGHSGLSVMGRLGRKKGKRVRPVPRVFGNGKVGTIAWAQFVGITRFSLATFLMGFVVVGIVVMASLKIDNAAEEEVMFSSLFIAGMGTIYLAMSMRFDFRSSLSRMESIKSWPLPPGRLFFGTVFPQVMLMTLLLVVGIIARIGLSGVFHPVVVECMALIPVVVYAWVALDNAIFLFFPVKFIPGQDGGVHHIGRSLLLLFLRFFLLIIAGIVLAAVLFLLSLAAKFFDLDPQIIESSALWILFVGILCACVVFTFAGGFALRRFDVSRQVS